ncbi:jg7961 [Pararge aegeria aegeria]|uniref:Jg7961 protein n=1 Tax=Pararge aegeria aegeria TaxID=348720 RepID=A0A8S4SEP7_9NEOP|nr:jg7961 [Pararge aegeria aegeria]
MNQRQLPPGPPTNAAMALMANTFKDTMCEMMAQMSQENRTILSEIMKKFQPEEARVRISDVYFPSFDPDKGMDVKEWVNLISRTQEEYKLKDHEVRLKAAGVLKGTAQSWADDCLLRTTTWAEMREDMLQTFEAESRYFSEVLKFRRYTTEKADTIPDYISTVWKMYKKLMKPNPTEQDAVEFIIGSITDDALRTELLNTKSNTVPELIAIAKTMRKRKNSTTPESLPQIKKTKFERSDQVSIHDNHFAAIFDSGADCSLYRLAPVEREKVQKIIKELMDKNIIRESNSPFASPIIMVKKKNGEDRLCVDYRELNANTVRDHYPLPLISEQLDQLADAKYFTCLDMAAGFHKIPISKESIEKTSFITPDGQYEYLTMPFGLTNAPSVYQRAINKALGDIRGKEALVYMDDVLIPSRTIAEGFERLERVLEFLTKAGFSINIKKCSFIKTSIEYLGFVVCDGKVRPSPSKVEALSRSLPPTNLKQLRQFNGLAGYFRRFIPNFSSQMIPLYNLTKSNSKWEWTAEHERTRSNIINYLTSAPLLTIFQEGHPIELHTDASAMGLGAVLIQLRDGVRHVIGYFSMRTTSAESNYHSYELETLAIVRAIKHFRHFLYGRKFTIMTDCNAVKASRYKQELLPRIHRWWAFLQNFDFEVEYRKGEKLKHADFF